MRRRDELVISARAVRFGLLLVALLLLLAIGFTQRERIGSVFAPAEARAIDGSTYQAVLLVSNQVYFGKLSIDGDVYKLNDVFYLASAPDANQPGQLLKRGTELHGPTEPMVIPARSVLYFENMRADSQVMQAIRAYKAGQTAAPATATPSAVPSQPAATPSRTPAPSASR